MEEQPWLDTIPRNVATTTRLCSFCRETGHNIVNCRRGYQAANILHQSILNVIRQSMENQSPGGIFQTIKEYLKLHTMKELKLIVRMHGDVHGFAQRLYLNNLFNITERCIQLKNGLVKILTLYYYQNVEIPSQIVNVLTMLPKKFNIVAKIEERNQVQVEQVFQCPICLEDKENTVCLTTNCNHNVCFDCFETYLEKLPREKQPCCSLCRTNISELYFTNKECCDKISNKYFNVL